MEVRTGFRRSPRRLSGMSSGQKIEVGDIRWRFWRQGGGTQEREPWGLLSLSVEPNSRRRMLGGGCCSIWPAMQPGSQRIGRDVR